MNTHNRLFALQVSFFALCLVYSAQLTMDAAPKLQALYAMATSQPAYVRALPPAAPKSHDAASASTTAGVHTEALRTAIVRRRMHSAAPARVRAKTARVKVSTHTSTLTSPDAGTAK
ncbi:hypothetical protein HY285_05305 [Candidatus Peregrinibacteria bacterium]|nr:hypothetical protein [Candidatus Peregrinibacteria bacterium]MBI3816928.1 hypothetical protein [Candidatus Peregrinibacteria bacterium]